MSDYKDIYYKALGLYKVDTALCEICGKPAVDIHHIERRGMGGTTNPESNSIFNLMALCRDCHIEYGDKVKYKRWLKVKHMRMLMQKGARLLGIYEDVEFKNVKPRGREREEWIIFKGESDTR